LHLELNHHAHQVENNPVSLSYVSLSADNAGLPQEDTHGGVHDD